MAIRYADLPPGMKFVPTDEQIVELYLLPRVRGQPDLIPDLILDDNSAANTHPWKLFSRHGLAGQPDGVPAFFFVRVSDTRPGARPDRGCHGGGSWKSMKSSEQVLPLVDGEEINYTRHNLNFQMGSGSVGWVMHEYAINQHPSLKICSISFSGHCKKRMRAPPDDSLAAKTAFVQDTSAAQDFEEVHQDPLQLLSDEEITEMIDELSDDAQLGSRSEEEPSMAINGEPYPYPFQQQIDEPSTTVEQIDEARSIIWEGIQFDLS